MALTPGSRIGSYEITAQIGAGGMGEVYRATDTKLGRPVAIKVLPDAVAQDAERLARFDREARTLASLNHPNIAAIHGLEDADGSKALVMELVEGPTLADRIAQGAIPVEEALPIATQIAAALEAAHEQGIIHRDLKPANIKLRPDGTVKVLDFGLAKAMEPSGAASASQTMSPTITTPAMTQAGLILGTAAYMSPEQARGKTVDRRSDIWAFGVVLFEMLTGRRAFEGEDITETIAAVVRAELDWNRMPPGLSPTLVAFIRRCLQKDPKQRVHDIADVRLALDGAFDTPRAAEPESAVVSLPLWRRTAPVALAIGVTALLVGGGAGMLTRPEPPPLARFEIVTPTETPPGAATYPAVALSPDGTTIVYASDPSTSNNVRLYVRRADELEPTALLGEALGANPFFSPDGETVGFFDSFQGALRRVSIRGGAASTIASTSSLDVGGLMGASWSPDGTIVFGRGRGGLWRVPAGGGDPEPLTSVPAGEGVSHRWPEVLPNGAGVLFTIWGDDSTATARIAVVSLDTRDVTELVTGGSYPRYAPSGHIVYALEGTLRAVAFDQDRLTITGNPVPVLEDVVTKESSGAADFAVARNGSLAYVTGPETGATATESTLVWVDRDGHEQPLGLASRAYFQAFVSPDGTKVAATVGTAGSSDMGLWVSDLARPVLTPIPMRDVVPFGHLWTADSRRLVFGSINASVPGVYWTDADGTGAVERLTTVEDVNFVSVEGWADGGQTLIFTYNAGGGRIGKLPMTGDGGERPWQPLLERDAGASMLAVSPDGGWIAYQSPAPGQYSVYVEPFPELGSRQLISDERGGWAPLWSRNGRELFYRRLGDGAMMRVPVRTSPTLAIEAPEVVFESDGYVPITTPAPGQGAARQYDIGPDGRFLMLKDAASEGGDVTRLVLVQNWLTELQRLVPTD